MRYLLDSHILIWALFDDAKLPEKAFRIINDPNNEIYYSAASIWEVEIKHLKSPEKIPVSGHTLAQWCEAADMIELPVFKEHIYLIGSLSRSSSAAAHNDPFDRVLISQAKAENMFFLTHDSMLADYTEACVITV